MTDQDMDFLIKVTEQYLDSTLIEKVREAHLSQSMNQRCQIAEHNVGERLLTAASNPKYGCVAVLPLFASDLEAPYILTRPHNTLVRNETFQGFVWNLADRGFKCFIDRPGLTSSALTNFLGLMPELGWKHYHMQELEEKQKVVWTLYVLLPSCEPPRRYWMRNVAFHLRGPVLMLLGITICALLSYVLFVRSNALNLGVLPWMITLSPLFLFPAAIYRGLKLDLTQG
ncbi:hypothetical protein S7335_1211 [Synechococcus sp. PCC 7335]|uniref:hypothetical protein n=1 Tax=Synechococcus sp. (strain ATCC 29403 / PCC 7335) TaxID=91464 RepID=UPI00017EB576|nr:hypothetical protein [Synechococcus sp. PCC 7335]EDX82507.1 hypothetical protein S7335_1211 [Synechococcus sp. PCC 7335]